MPPEEAREANFQEPAGPSSVSSGTDDSFRCLVVAARVLGLPADYNQLKRAWPEGKYPELALLRAARSLSIKAKKTTGTVERLIGMPLPAMAFMLDGSVALVLKGSPEKLLVYVPGDQPENAAPRPTVMETTARESSSGLLNDIHSQVLKPLRGPWNLS